MKEDENILQKMLERYSKRRYYCRNQERFLSHSVKILERYSKDTDDMFPSLEKETVEIEKRYLLNSEDIRKIHERYSKRYEWDVSKFQRKILQILSLRRWFSSIKILEGSSSFKEKILWRYRKRYWFRSAKILEKCSAIDSHSYWWNV